MTPEKMLREFHAAAGDEPGRGEPTLRGRLVAEEFDEVMRELGSENGEYDYYIQKGFQIDKAKLAKELADLVVVAYGTADAFDIPLEAVLAEVHRSNMTKFSVCGHCDGDGEWESSTDQIYNCQICKGTGRIKKLRDDGKILKPDTYEEADIEKVLNGN